MANFLVLIILNGFARSFWREDSTCPADAPKEVRNCCEKIAVFVLPKRVDWLLRNILLATLPTVASSG